MICSHPSFFDHFPDQLIDELVEFLGVAFTPVFEPLVKQALRNAAHLDQLLDDRLTQGINSVWIAHIAKAVLKTALKEELG